MSDMEEHITFHEFTRYMSDKKERSSLTETKLYCKLCKFVCVAKLLTKTKLVRLV